MTLKEVLDMHIRTEQGLRFDVEYSCVSHDVETDELIGFTLIKTAEEAYQEWLADKDKTVEPNEMEVLETRVDGLENINAGLLLENAEQQIKIQEQEKMNKEQEVTNANLLLEIAMLKGAML